MGEDCQFTHDEVLGKLAEPPLPEEDAPVDLHTHTDASDGSYEPEELVRRAAEAGLAAIAVTDHDTLAGLERACRAGLEHGIRVIPGVELSCRIPDGTLHILGYFVLPGSGRLDEKLTWLRDERLSRGSRIVERLNELGLALDPADVEAKAKGGALGRPHIAQALVDAGHVKDAQEAFDKYLMKGAPAYVDKAVLPMDEAVGAIKACGGVPVMAHPHQTNREGDDLKELISGLVSAGLRGIEAHYSLHTPEQTAEYLGYAEEFGLIITGGTDYHGPRKKDISLGVGKGDMHIPYRLVLGLMEEAKK